MADVACVLAAAARLELVCLGVGAGKTTVYDGETSSAFLLRKCVAAGDAADSDGVLLIDCGLGVVRACLRQVPRVPKLIFVSHNHTDHAGELPVILAVERARRGGCKPTVIAEHSVANVLQERRLYETTSVGAFAADWIACEASQLTPIGHDLGIRIVGPCRHTELCFGFVLYRARSTSDPCQGSIEHEGRVYQPLFGFTADSGLDVELLRQLAVAPIILADARAVGTSEHASFDDLREWRAAYAFSGRLVVYHYGSLAEAPEDGIGGLEVARPGAVVASWQCDRSCDSSGVVAMIDAEVSPGG